jgi:hypothetical protein
MRENPARVPRGRGPREPSSVECLEFIFLLRGLRSGDAPIDHRFQPCASIFGLFFRPLRDNATRDTTSRRRISVSMSRPAQGAYGDLSMKNTGVASKQPGFALSLARIFILIASRIVLCPASAGLFIFLPRRSSSGARKDQPAPRGARSALASGTEW